MSQAARAAIEITAADRFSAVFKTLQSQTQSAGAGLDRLKGLAAGAFAVFTTGAVATAIGQTVTRLAALDDAAQMTGASVERLSKIRNVADEFGVAFDSVTGAMAKLTKGLSGADEETKGAAAALKILGIETRDANGHLRSSGDLFDDVARELAQYTNDTEKAAFAQAIFGKGGEKLIPFLNDYAKNMDRAGTVTAEQAERAADLEDAYRRMTASGTRFREQLAIETLPVMTAVVNALEQLQNESRKTGQETGIAIFAENAASVLAVLADSIVTFSVRLKGLGGDIEGVAQYSKGVLDRLAAGAAARFGDVAGAAKIYAESNERFAAGSAAFDRAAENNAFSSTKVADALQRALLVQKAQIGAYDDARDRINRVAVARAAADEADKKGLGDKAKALAALAEKAKAAADAAREAQRIAEVFAKINGDVTKLATDVNADASGDKLTEGQKKALEIIKQLTDEKNKFSDATKAAIAAQLEAILTTERETLTRAEVAKAYEAQLDAVEKLREAAERETESLEQRAQAALEEADNLGKTRVQIAREAAARAERLVVMAREAGASDEAISNLERQAEAYRNLAVAASKTDAFEAGAKFAEDQKRAMEDAARSSEEFFTNLILNGKKTWGDLKQQAKQFFAQLAAQFLTRYVLNIGVNGSVSGGGGIGNILGSVLGGGGGGGVGNILGSLLGGGGSLFGGLSSLAMNAGLGTTLMGPTVAGAALSGGTGIAGFFSAAAGGFMGGLATLGTAVTSGVAAAGGLATVLGAAVPVIGPLIALAAAFGLGKDKKGFKLDNAGTGGGSDGRGGGRSNVISSIFGVYDFAGDFDNKMVQPFIDAVGKIDKAIADAFLTSPDAVKQAEQRVQAIRDGSWFGANSKEETEASIKAATLRFLKERYAAVFDTIDADLSSQIAGFSGTTDELTAFLTQVAALAPVVADLNTKFPELKITLSQLLKTAEEDRAAIVAIVNTLPNTVKDGWGEVQKIMERANEGIAGSLRRSMQASIDLVRASDKGSLSLQSLASAMEQSQAGFAQLANAIAGIAASIAESISATNDNFLLATLSEEDRYKFFQDRANSTAAGIGSLNNEEAIRRAVERINADREAAFNLLDPEEQRARLQEFLDGGNALNDAAQAQLKLVAETAAAQQKEFAALVAKAMLDAVAEQSKVVDKQSDSVDRFEGAVTRFERSAVRVEIVNVGNAYEARSGF